MSIYGDKRKEIPILSYELKGTISDEVGEDKMRWHHTHVLHTFAGTFSFSLTRRPKVRDLFNINRYGNSLFVGPNNVDYEAPDFATYMTDDAEMLNQRLTGR